MQSNAGAMDLAAREFDQVNEDIQQMLNGLLSRLEGLQTAWRGAGGRSFEQVKTQWSEEQMKLSRALEQMASSIRSAGNQYSASDAEAASRIMASGASGFQLKL